MLQLGSKEHPVTVTCNVSTPFRSRYIYVRIDEVQRSQIEALECLELDRLTPPHYTQKGTNVYNGECKLRLPSKAYSLAGCKVTLVVRPGMFRHSRGEIGGGFVCDPGPGGPSAVAAVVHIGTRNRREMPGAMTTLESLANIELTLRPGHRGRTG